MLHAMSIKGTVAVRCPSCGTSHEAALVQSINARTEPELVGQLLAGELNVLACQCGRRTRLEATLLFHDPDRDYYCQACPGGEAAMAEGRFRQDLYYRIRGLELNVPPLRARREDLLVLASYFLERVSERRGQPLAAFSREAVDRLLSYAWPGNVRELEHAVAAAAALAEGDEIRAADLPLPSPTPEAAGFDFSSFAGLPLTEARSQLVDAFDRWMIQRALDEHDGNVSAAARQLGIHRQSLQQKIAQLGIAR